MERRKFMEIAASGMGLLSGCSAIKPGPEVGVSKGEIHYLASVGERHVDASLNIAYPSELRMGVPTHVTFEVTIDPKGETARQSSLESIKVLMLASGDEKERWSTTEVNWGEPVDTEFVFVYPQTRELNITYIVTPVLEDGHLGTSFQRSDELIAESQFLI